MNKSNFDTLLSALDRGAFTQALAFVANIHPGDTASLIESLPPAERALLWRLFDDEQAAGVLPYLSEEVRADMLEAMAPDAISSALSSLDTDDLVDILKQLPERIIEQVLSDMHWQDRQRVERVLQYPERSAGALMDTSMVTIRADITLEVVLRYLRRHDYLPDATDNLLVVDAHGKFLGLLSLSKLLVSPPTTLVREVMATDVAVFQVDQSADEVAEIFERQDLVSAPVIDADDRLLGRITIDDVLDLIRSTSDDRMFNMAYLSSSEDTFASWDKVISSRARWLGINLLTAILASLAISLFDAAIEKVVALAILMPIVASMGGIAGTQVLTIMVRALAMRQINWANVDFVLKRELRVGLSNGVLWALVVSTLASLWFGDWLIAMIIAVALLVNILVAALTGVLLPLLLEKLRIDPALAGGVILTTVSDVTGFVTFLGLASWVYL